MFWLGGWFVPFVRAWGRGGRGAFVGHALHGNLWPPTIVHSICDPVVLAKRLLLL